MNVEKLEKHQKASRFIVIEGSIGAGKTSLAKRLAESFSGELILEKASENPFLEGFYRNRRKDALPTQLFFLFQRAKQLEELRQADMFASIRVADFHIDKDRLFAEINLNPEEMELYNKICEKVEMKSIAPDLVIYLQASVDALLQRIYHRDISHETFIDKHYLESLNEAFAQHYYNYDEAPLLIVNTTSIDPINNDADYLQLLEQIEQTTSGRHFYNPITEVAFG